MDFYKLFYYLTVGDKLSDFFFVIAFIFSIISAILLIVNLLSGDTEGVIVSTYIKGNDAKQYKVYQPWFVRMQFWQRYIAIIAIVFWIPYILIPNKKEAVLIIGGGYVGNFITQDSSAKQLPSDIVYFIRSNLQKYADEAQVEIRNLTNTKTLADSLSEMTNDQLKQYILDNKK